MLAAFQLYTQPTEDMREVRRTLCGVVERTRVSRNFEFELVNDERGHCVDDDDNTYSFGAFEDVKTYTDCAERCVDDGDAGIRGIEFDCSNNVCKCLYDPDVDVNNGVFDNTGSGDGEGPIEDTLSSGSHLVYCGALADNMEVQVESKAAIA